MPKVSVIVPCYNQSKYITECLDSVLAQTFTDYEVIVVNDGSTDNSSQIIRQYIQKYENFKLIEQPNHGVVIARNNAMISGKGDIITSRVMQFGEKTGEIVQRSVTPYHLSIGNCLVNSALFRKTDFIKTNGYSEDFVLGLEDYDLWLNMILIHKLKAYRVPDILFFYRIKNLESRNKHALQYRSMLKRKLLKKYPQMIFYKLCAKLQMFFYHSKIKNGYWQIKIFGIQIYKKKIKI